MMTNSGYSILHVWWFLSLLILASLRIPDLSAQSGFERTYGGFDSEHGRSVLQTADNGYVIVGYTSSFGEGLRDVYLVRTDAFGDTLWTKTYGGPEDDEGFSVEATSDGGFIITGYTSSVGSGFQDLLLIKTDSGGDLQWTRTYGGTLVEYGHDVRQTSDGGFIVTGYTTSYGAGQRDLFLVKTDGFGALQWQKTFGGAQDEEGYSVRQTADGGYIVAGYSFSFGIGLHDVYLIKTDTDGNEIWSRTHGGFGSDFAHAIEQTPGGGFIAAGWTDSFGSGLYDVYLIRTDPSGSSLWSKTYGGLDYDQGFSVQRRATGGYIVTGYTESFGAGRSDVYAIETDSTGSELWSGTFGGTDQEEGVSVRQTRDGGYVIAGFTRSSGEGSSDFYLIKTDAQNPIAISAEGFDIQNPVPGIDNDDQVLIIFDEATNMPVIDALNIDQVLQLSDGHTWTDPFGTIGGAIWNPMGDRLLITLSTNFGLPTLEIGDTITPDGVTINDQSGNPWLEPVEITGSFDPAVGVGDRGPGPSPPGSFDLSQNYPNPFNPSTTIEYAIPDGSGELSVEIAIYDLRGRMIRRLVDGTKSAGNYRVFWDGRDSTGREADSGVYIVHMKAGSFESRRKMVLLK